MLCSKCHHSGDGLTDDGLCPDCHLEAEERRSEIIELAREQRGEEGAVEIDDSAELSEGGDNGCYVQAWVRIDFDGTKFDRLTREALTINAMHAARPSRKSSAARMALKSARTALTYANIEMNDMKLERLLNQITPLPWRKLPGITGKQVGKEMPANEAYACHAANVLPELLAAAKNLRDNWERNLTEPMTRLSEAIELAEEMTADGEADAGSRLT
jgi:hypothetical protein